MFYAKAKFNQLEVHAETREEINAIVAMVKAFFDEVGVNGEIETGTIEDTFNSKGEKVGHIIVTDVK